MSKVMSCLFTIQFLSHK